MLWRRASSLLMAAAAVMTAMPAHVRAGGSAEPLCSIPPGTYTQAKQAHPEVAFALAELEKHGIATWYSDRESNGDYVATAKQLVATCPESSRLSVVVYGLPNKDCEARESMVGTRNQNSAMYQEFVSQLQQTVGSRKVLYVLEPDAVALLAGGGCAQQFGYGDNLAIAIRTLSQNPNADIYLDVGHWMLSSDAKLASVASIVRGLMTAGRVKGITINTSNYRSNDELSGLCGKFRGAMSGTDLHCVIDTSRNYKGPSAQSEWCNYKNAAIGKVPTGSTGDPNIDYYVWIKPPGDSDGVCASGHTSDTLAGPGAGGFFLEHFKTLWNDGSLVQELGMPKIDGTIRPVDASTIAPATTPAAETPSPSNSTAAEEDRSNPSADADDNTTTASTDGSVAASSLAGATLEAGSQSGVGTVASAPTDEPVFANTPVATPAASETTVQEITTKSAEAGSMATGFIVLICMIAVALVALVVVVVFRARQKSLEESKTPLEPRIHYLSNTPSQFSTL